MADIQFEFAAGAGDLLKELKQIKQEFVEIRDANASSKKEMSESFQQAAKGADEYQAELSKALKMQMEQKQIIGELKKQFDELKQSQSNSLDANKARVYAAEIEKLRTQIRQLQDDLSNKKGKKVEVIPEGSILEARAGLKNLKAEIASLDTAARNSNVGKYLAKEVAVATAELKKMEAQAGLSGTGTNNALTKAFSGLRQIAYVLPGIGIAGILGAISEELINLVKPLFESNKELVKQSDILTESKQKYVEVAANVSKLKLDVALAKDGFIDKNVVIKEYNETMGKTAGSAKTLDEVEQSLARNADAYVKFTLYKAAANLALEKSAAAAFEAENTRLKESSDFKGVTDFTSMYQNYQTGITLNEQQLHDVEKSIDNEQEKRKQKAIDKAQEQSDAYKGIADRFTKEAAKIAKDFKFDYEPTKTEKNKTVEAFKDRSSQIIALEKQLVDLRVAVLKDGREKEIAIENARFDDLNSKAINSIKQYNAEVEKVLSSKKSTADKQKEIAQITQLIQLQSKIIEQEKITHTAKLLAIDLKYYEDAIKSFEATQKAINNVLLKDEDKEIQQLTDKYDAIFKSIEESRKKNLALAKNPIQVAAVNIFYDDQSKQVTEKMEKETLAIKQKYSLKQLQEAEDLAIAQNELIKIKGLTQGQLERVKETNKLNIIIEFGKKRLAILEASGNAENALQIAQLKKTIQDAENEIKKKKGKEKDIFELLGIDLGSPENNKAFAKALNITKDAIESLVSSLVQLQDQEVQKSKERLQLIEDELSAQEKAVDREKQLAEDGYANNLGLEQQKLNDLKKQKEEELKVQQEAQKKKEALQKTAIVADGIAQVSNLITAGSEIMKGFSAIPIIGVGLGIAAVSLMIGAFVASKVAAFNAVSKAEKGRRVASGNRHSSGGNKYQSIDGNDPDILEIEEGEWVVNRKSSAKYDPLLKAINDDQLSAMSVPQLQRMLEPLGIRLQDDLPEKIVRQYEQVTYNNANNVTQQDHHLKGELKNQNRLLERIASNTEKTTEYHDGYRIEREGNRTRKIMEQ